MSEVNGDVHHREAMYRWISTPQCFPGSTLAREANDRPVLVRVERG